MKAHPALFEGDGVGGEGRVEGRGKKVLIIALLLLYDASGKCSSIKVFSIFARKLALTTHHSPLGVGKR